MTKKSRSDWRKHLFKDKDDGDGVIGDISDAVIEGLDPDA
jgi:hypothetical protein